MGMQTFVRGSHRSGQSCLRHLGLADRSFRQEASRIRRLLFKPGVAHLHCALAWASQPLLVIRPHPAAFNRTEVTVKQLIQHSRTHALGVCLSKHLQCGWVRVSKQLTAQSAEAYRESAVDLRTAQRIRVAVPASIGHAVIAPALPRFLEQHRSMRVDLLIAEEGSTSDQCDAVLSIRPVDSEPQACARRLAITSHVLCASEEFWAVHGMPRGPQEIDPAHCIGLLDEHLKPRRWSFHRGSTEIAIEPAAPIMFGDAQSAVLAAIRGGGMILAPALAVEAQIAAGLLKPVMWDWSAPRHAIWLQHTRRPTAQMEAFAEFVAGLLPSDSQWGEKGAH